MGFGFDNKVRIYFDCYRYFGVFVFGCFFVGKKIESIFLLRVEDFLLWVFN